MKAILKYIRWHFCSRPPVACNCWLEHIQIELYDHRGVIVESDRCRLKRVNGASPYSRGQWLWCSVDYIDLRYLLTAQISRNFKLEQTRFWCSIAITLHFAFYALVAHTRCLVALEMSFLTSKAARSCSSIAHRLSSASHVARVKRIFESA